jgi:hypothetical protein
MNWSGRDVVDWVTAMGPEFDVCAEVVAKHDICGSGRIMIQKFLHFSVY